MNEYIQQILRRKEVYSLKKQYEPACVKDDHYDLRDQMMPSAHQLMARNVINPNGFHSLFINHGTGTGKTLLAITVAMSFVREYRRKYDMQRRQLRKLDTYTRRYLNEITPNVVVLGFGGTKQSFVDDLLSFPDFGFISNQELARLNELAANAHLSEHYMEAYRDYKNKLQRRVSDKSQGGFFRFYGYRDFVNRLFGANVLERIEAEIREEKQIGENTEAESAEMVEGAELMRKLESQIESGRVRVNQEMLSSLENGMLICDEIHNTYNSLMLNNWGIAIQYARDHVPNMRLMPMSATHIVNTPAEEVDVLNMLRGDRLRKRDYFNTNVSPKTGATEKLGRLSRGYFSFYDEYGTDQFPHTYYYGRVLPNSAIDMKLHTVSMQGVQKKTYEHYFGDRDRISYAYHVIYDLVFPGVGRYGSLSFGEAYDQVEQMQDVSTEQVSKDTILTGEWLQLPKLRQYSAKYAEFVEQIIQSMRQGLGEKVVAYHNDVKGSGVLLIQEALRMNGFVVGRSNVITNDTLCARCGTNYGKHKGKDHEFAAARVMTIHARESTRGEEYRRQFNSDSNADGSLVKVLLGSRKIMEAYNFYGTHRMFVLSLPTNLSYLEQVIGRARRKGSHLAQPQHKRYVVIHIMCHLDTVEEHRYRRKMHEYLPIKELKREVRRNAVDAGIHYERINTQTQSESPLEIRSYEPAVSVPSGLRLSQLSDHTFRAHDYFREEIGHVAMIIKRLFSMRSVYTYQQLLDAVRHPPFYLSINPELISERSIIIALTFMLQAEHRDESTSLIQQLMNPNDPIICNRNFCGTLFQRGQYYIMAQKPEANTFIQPLPERQDKHVPYNEALDQYLRHHKYREIKEDLVDKYSRMDYDCLHHFYMQISCSIQRIIIEDAIAFDQGMLRVSEGRRKQFYRNLLHSLSRLSAVFTVGYLRENMLEQLDFTGIKPNRYIGYLNGQYIHMLSPDGIRRGKADSWMLITRVSVGLDTNFTENDTLVGILEPHREGQQFKVREPRQTADVEDRRTLHSGIVCHTRFKSSIQKDLANFTDKKFGDARIKSMCDLLYYELFQRECQERTRGSNIKWMYMWWDVH